MPESSTAMRAATTDPAPARSVYRLDMSESTPILTTLSEICACAAPAPSVAATATAIRLRFVAFMNYSLSNGLLRRMAREGCWDTRALACTEFEMLLRSGFRVRHRLSDS